MTYRQFQVWNADLDAEWDEPSRTDQYLMQIAYEVRRGNAKDPNRVQFKDLKLRFGDGEPVILTVKEASRRTKERWSIMFGMEIK